MSFSSCTFRSSIAKLAGSLNRDSIVSGFFVYRQCSELRLMHLVNSSVSFGAWLGMVEPPWKRFGAFEIVPEWVEMIKTDLIEIKCGWGMGVSGF